MRKRELVKIWKQLDECLNALETLDEIGMLKVHENRIDPSAIINLKNEVEDLIRTKEKTSHIDLK